APWARGRVQARRRRAPMAGDRDERGRRVVGPQADEPSGCDTDDRVKRGADLDGGAERVATSAVTRLPETVTQHGDSRPAGRPIFVGREVAAESRRGVEESEETRAHHADVHLAGIGTGSDGELRLRDLRRAR